MGTAEVISSENQGEALSNELLVARFRTFAKEHFQDFIKNEIDYLQYIKKSAQLYSFHLPADKGEFFIHYEAAPFFWLCDSPVVLKLEEWMKLEGRGKSAMLESYRSIKEFYIKWAILKSDQEKKYYALSTIKLIERDTNKGNLLKLILHAVILAFDKKIFQPVKALELLVNAMEVLETMKLDDKIKNEFRYLVNIYMGFVNLKIYEYAEAGQKFAEALVLNPSGLTAKFYLAFTEKRAGNADTAIQLLSEIIEFDKTAIEYAVENNSIVLLGFFIRNAATYNIFNEGEFAGLLEDIEATLSATLGLGGFAYEDLGNALSRLGELYLRDFYSEEVLKNLDFLEKAYQAYLDNRNLIAQLSRPPVEEKLRKTIQAIINTIKNRYTAEIYDKLKQYDIGINENHEIIRHLTQESEEAQKVHNKRLEEELQELERRISDNIALIEGRIENIHLQKKFDPQVAFNNAMLYNFIVTLIIFTIGGFSGCFRESIDDVYDYRGVMMTVVLAGLKWGVFTFFLGTIISMFFAAFAVIERTGEKQKLLKKITYLKGHKERENELLKRENERRLKTIVDNYNERVDSHKKSAEKLKAEKDEHYLVLQEGADKKIAEYQEKLDWVLRFG